MTLGEWASLLIAGFIPGNVLGMVFIFVALSIGWVRVEDVRPVAQFLTQNMIWFFVPASIGLMDQYALVQDIWWGFLLISVLTTILVIVSVGWVQEWQIRRRKRLKQKGGQV